MSGDSRGLVEAALQHWPFPLAPKATGVVGGTVWATSWNMSFSDPGIDGYAFIPDHGHPYSGFTDVRDLPIAIDGPAAVAREVTFGRHLGAPTEHFDPHGWVGFHTTTPVDFPWSVAELRNQGIIVSEIGSRQRANPRWHWSAREVASYACRLALAIDSIALEAKEMRRR